MIEKVRVDIKKIRRKAVLLTSALDVQQAANTHS
jgi:hypothetical protein